MTDVASIYRQALPGRIAALELARSQMGGDSEAAAASIRRIAHALRGSGGTYGFPEVSHLAAAVEDADDVDLQRHLHELIAVLRALVGTEPCAHILGIEDEPEHALLIRTILAAPGRTVTVVGTAAEALKVLQQEAVSLIVLDLLLPDMDGRSLLLRLRERETTASTPVIVLSARSDPQAKAECFDLGATGFLDKPVEPDLLAAVVGAQLRGAVFARSPAARSDRAGERAPREGGFVERQCVLVVEDDELVASVLRTRLERDGFHILHCGDGMSAIEALEHERFVLIILDVKIPGVDGFDVLTRLRGLPSNEDTPVIMLTSMGAGRDLLRAFQLGADDCITKPFSPVEVLARVDRLLEA